MVAQLILVPCRTLGGDGSPEGSDMKRMKRLMRVKTFKVELSFAGKVPLSAITKAEAKNLMTIRKVFRFLISY